MCLWRRSNSSSRREGSTWDVLDAPGDCFTCDPKGCSTEGTGPCRRPPLPPHSPQSTGSEAAQNSHKSRSFRGLCIPTSCFPRGANLKALGSFSEPSPCWDLSPTPHPPKGEVEAPGEAPPSLAHAPGHGAVPRPTAMSLSPSPQPAGLMGGARGCQAKGRQLQRHLDKGLHPFHKCCLPRKSWMRRGGGSHKSQGILSSSWGDRGWEGEGASTGMGKRGGMRNDGNEGGGGNSQVRWNGLCGGMCLKECWEKQPHFPARRDFPTFHRFSMPLLQELGSPGSPTLPSPNYPSWRGHGSHGRSQPHHCGSQVPSTNSNPILFPQPGSLGSQTLQHSPWDGEAALAWTLLLAARLAVPKSWEILGAEHSRRSRECLCRWARTDGHLSMGS